jgi:hypothetical protein
MSGSNIVIGARNTFPYRSSDLKADVQAEGTLDGFKARQETGPGHESALNTLQPAPAMPGSKPTLAWRDTATHGKAVSATEIAQLVRTATFDENAPIPITWRGKEYYVKTHGNDVTVVTPEGHKVIADRPKGFRACIKALFSSNQKIHKEIDLDAKALASGLDTIRKLQGKNRDRYLRVNDHVHGSYREQAEHPLPLTKALDASDIAQSEHNQALNKERTYLGIPKNKFGFRPLERRFESMDYAGENKTYRTHLFSEEGVGYAGSKFIELPQEEYTGQFGTEKERISKDSKDSKYVILKFHKPEEAHNGRRTDGNHIDFSKTTTFVHAHRYAADRLFSQTVTPLVEETETGPKFQRTNVIDFKPLCKDLNKINKQKFYWYDLKGLNTGKDKETGELRFFDCAEKDFVFVQEANRTNPPKCPATFGGPPGMVADALSDVRAAEMTQSHFMLMTMFECDFLPNAFPVVVNQFYHFAINGELLPEIERRVNRWVTENVRQEHQSYVIKLLTTPNILYNEGAPIPTTYDLIDWDKAERTAAIKKSSLAAQYSALSDR